MALRSIHQIGTLFLAANCSNNHSSQSRVPASTAAVRAVPVASILRSRVSNRETEELIVSSLNSFRRSFSVSCRASTAAAAVAVEEEEKGGKRRGVPVFVMMPLDSVKMENKVNRRKTVEVSFQAMKGAGVEGVMVDVWWGLVEKERPGEYNFGGYEELLAMAAKFGLKVQAVMSFHQCGGNVGDSCM